MRTFNFLRILFAATTLTVCHFVAATLRSDIASSAGDRFISVPDGIDLLARSQAEASWHDPAVAFIDVRPLEDYKQGHIQGAIHLAYEEMAETLPPLREKLSLASQLIVYCKSVDCGKSLWAAIRLKNQGHQQIAIYPGGWNEWVLAGLPVSGEGR